MPTTRDGGAGVTLSSGLLDATFVPELGMVGVSLRHAGHELLALPGGLDGYRAGNVTGLPLLAPWANRLGASRYEVEDVVVDLADLPLHTDGHGLPIHGTMSARPGWEVIATAPRRWRPASSSGPSPTCWPRSRSRTSSGSTSPSTPRRSMDTTVVPTSDRPSRWRSATTRTSASRPPGGPTPASDSRGAGTSSSTPGGCRPGRHHAEDAEDEPLGTRVFDDLYELGDDRQLALGGGGRRITLAVGDGYGTPRCSPRLRRLRLPRTDDRAGQRPGRRRLRPGPPGTSFTARFALHVEDDR